MTKRLRLLGNERVDLSDALYGMAGFPVAEIRHHVAELLGDLAGVVEGFEVSIEGPTNVIRVHPGTALDRTLQLVHVNDLPTTSALLALEGPGLHHVGVVFRLAPSDSAPRTFFDPDAVNPDGSHGREFVQNVRTRFTTTWQPVVSLGDPTFAGVIPDPSLVVPLAVVPVTTDPVGHSVIDTAALAGKLGPAVGKLRSIRTIPAPPRTVLGLERAELFRLGGLVSVPASSSSYTITSIDPIASEIGLDRELAPDDRVRLLATGVVTSADVSLILGRGRLADPTLPGDVSEPGDVRYALFVGNAARGARLLAAPRDDRLGPGERFVGRDESALGTTRNLRDALALLLGEIKFGEAAPGATWIDPIPVPLWDLARFYLRDLQGTGILHGGVSAAVQLPPPIIPLPFNWVIRTTISRTVFYANGIRHVLPETSRQETVRTAPTAPTIYVYWWAIARSNALVGPDWPDAAVEVVSRQTTSFSLEPTPPPADPDRSVLLGAVRLSGVPPAGTPLHPAIMILETSHSPRRVADRFGFDVRGRIQRDLVFRSVPGVNDPGRTLRPDSITDPEAKLNVDLGTGRLLGRPGARIELQQSPTQAARIECKEAGTPSATVARVWSRGIDLQSAGGSGGRAVRLWSALADAAPRGEWRIEDDPGGGLDSAGAEVPSVVALGPPNAAGALQLRAVDRLVGGVVRDGTIFTHAEVLEVRRRLRLLGQLSLIGEDRDASGASLGPERGFNFINPYKIPLAWAYVTFTGTSASLHAQSHLMNSNGRPVVLGLRGTAWLPPFQAPVFGPTSPVISAADPTKPQGTVRILGTPPDDGALRVFQLPWSSFFPLTRDVGYVVTVSATPDWDAWSAPAGRPIGAIWWGAARDYFFPTDPASRLDAADGPILAYTWPWVSGVLLQVWNALGRGSRGPSDPATSQSDTYLRSV